MDGGGLAGADVGEDAPEAAQLEDPDWYLWETWAEYKNGARPTWPMMPFLCPVLNGRMLLFGRIVIANSRDAINEHPGPALISMAFDWPEVCHGTRPEVAGRSSPLRRSRHQASPERHRRHAIQAPWPEDHSRLRQTPRERHA